MRAAILRRSMLAARGIVIAPTAFETAGDRIVLDGDFTSALRRIAPNRRLPQVEDGCEC